jgi:hypothetical protein
VAGRGRARLSEALVVMPRHTGGRRDPACRRFC